MVEGAQAVKNIPRCQEKHRLKRPAHRAIAREDARRRAYRAVPPPRYRGAGWSRSGINVRGNVNHFCNFMHKLDTISAKLGYSFCLIEAIELPEFGQRLGVLFCTKRKVS